MPLLAGALLALLFTSGCAGPEEKLGRGVSDATEFARGGEMRRYIEQTAIFESPGAGYTVGAIRGFDHSLARTGLGLYEIITFPIPPYDPILTRYVKPGTFYPESYRPGLISCSLFDTDTYTGFSGGDVAPWVPGCRFRVFDN